MALVYMEPELLIALEKKVIFVNPNDLQIFKDVVLPADFTQCGLKAATADGEEQQAKSQRQEQTPTIKNIALSADRQLLAIATAGQKAVLLYHCYPVHAKLISVRPLTRASSALTFSADSKNLLVTDKTGDCYQYDCENLEAPPKLLFGHLSVVYAVLLTKNDKFVITCDRDDKIRITNYPDTFDIHGYCLGHREFVAGMALLQENDLVSVSGDKTLRIWDYSSGKELAKVELAAPATRLALRQDGDKLLAAVLLHQPEDCVVIYELQKHSDGSWIIKESSQFSVNANVTAQHLCFAGDRLYVTGISEDKNFTIKSLELANSKPTPENWVTMVEEQFNRVPWKPEDIDVWYKKKYDNVSDYLERKKRRIEEKQSKK